MNNRLSLEFGRTYTRIPLRTTPHVVRGDALEMDWEDVLPAGDCDYVFGNPPFRGKSQQSKGQAAQVRRVAELGKQGGTLDYVAAWFIKAGAYVSQTDKPVRIGFVATNSVTQGEQVGLLWPVLFDRHGLELAFAHRTFAWGSDARGKAHVHVVIVGLDRRRDARPNKRLFNYADVNGEPDEQRCRALSPYLFDAGRMTDPHLTVQKVNRPINGFRRLKTGVQMIDNGLLTFTGDEREEFLADEPGAAKFFRRYIGGDEYINGFHRWILYLAEASPAELRRLPRVAERVAAVRRYRASRSRESTVKMADFPTRIGVDHRLAEPFLVLPNTSSERRHYIPIGWLTPEVVANQKLRILPKATLAEFGLLTSAMHMAWVRTVTGRMKSDYMYSVGVVYNTFPAPPSFSEPGESGISRLNPLAQAVLDARSEHPDATLADLYDPDLMPATLRGAHQGLDRAVDRLYRRERFMSENDRLEYLFGLYERMQAPLVTEVAKPGRRRRRRSTARR